jgi:hypothetical protein
VVFGLSICDMVLLFLNAILISVFFEEVGYFPHFGSVICKCGPFRVVWFSFLFDFWWVVLCCICCLRLVISLLGKLLLRTMFCMVFHSRVRVSFVSVSESILLM